MTHYLIKSINAIVSDAEINSDEVWYVDDTNTVRKSITNDADYWKARKDYKKIEYSNNKIEGLKPFELVDEVEELAYKELDSEATIGITTKGESQMFIQGFFKGYKTKAGFTKEDMRACWIYAIGHSYSSFSKYLQEQESRMIEVIQISDSVFKIKN